MSFSLGPSAVVGTLYYKDLEPPVSTIEERFTTDTDIDKDKVVMLKSNGNVEAVTGEDLLAPSFPVAPYQAYDSTGSAPGDYPSPMYIAPGKVLFGYERTSGRTLSIRYADVVSQTPDPFTFGAIQTVYTAGGTNNIQQNRFVFDEINASPTEAKGVAVWNETGGTAAKVGTWIVGWSFDIASQTVTSGTPFQLQSSPVDADAVFLTEDRLCVIQANNSVRLMTVDWTDKTFQVNATTTADVNPVPSYTIPQITKVIDGTDYYIQCWYVLGSPARPFCTPQKIDLATNTFTKGTRGENVSISTDYAISHTPRENQFFYMLVNQSSPGLGIYEWTFDKDALSMTGGAGFSVSSGSPNAIEYLHFIQPDGTIKNYVVYFNEGYISNYPTSGYFDLDTSSNFVSIITTATPGEPAGMAVLQEDLDIVLAWLGSGDARCALCNLGTRTTNLNANRVIGVAKDSGVVGDKIRVELLGSVAVVDTLETLVPLSDVYVEADGKITQTKNIGDVKIGKALSSTKILLTPTPEQF